MIVGNKWIGSFQKPEFCGICRKYLTERPDLTGAETFRFEDPTSVLDPILILARLQHLNPQFVHVIISSIVMAIRIDKGECRSGRSPFLQAIRIGAMTTLSKLSTGIHRNDDHDRIRLTIRSMIRIHQPQGPG